ncbi:MAG: hypothetical protein DMF63_05120 [Acidobacteria bacterium]|nr:MAG: hypothetical protein DMF63_05120 [Acidobacteriota bacterium]
MFSLEELLGQQQGSEAVQQISDNVGAEPSAVNSAIQAALPMILGSLASNASSTAGAESLNNALEKDHSGSILDNLGGLGSMIFGDSATPREADGGGILGHILGGNQGAVVQQATNQSGLNSGQVAQILMMLAPIVMGYLGRQKQEQGVGADGLGGLLGGLLGGQQAAAAPQSSGNAMIDMASNALDSDHDGSSLDDIASMALNYFKNK